MRHLAITGMSTAAMISRMILGLAMRATPPSARIWAGTRSRAITATAPERSAISAWAAVVTSMITPPFSISARPVFRRRLVGLWPLFWDMVGLRFSRLFYRAWAIPGTWRFQGKHFFGFSGAQVSAHRTGANLGHNGE